MIQFTDRGVPFDDEHPVDHTFVDDFGTHEVRCIPASPNARPDSTFHTITWYCTCGDSDVYQPNSLFHDSQLAKLKAGHKPCHFNVAEASAAQQENASMLFAPSNGICWSCGRNIYKRYSPAGPGVSVERAATMVTGCPHCNRSYVD